MRHHSTNQSSPNQTIDAQYEWFLSKQGVTIDAVPPKKRPKLPSEWTFKECMQVLFAIVFVGTFGTFAFLFVSLMLLGAWTHFFG